MYAEIIIEISNLKLDRPFTYRIPPKLKDCVVPGSRVIVPFGRGNRRIKGYCVAVRQTEDVSLKGVAIKDLLEVVTDDGGRGSAREQLLDLAVWMKSSYGGTLVQALRTVLPVKKAVRKRSTRTVSLLLGGEEAEEKYRLFVSKHQMARARLLSALMECKSSRENILKDTLNITGSVITSLEKQGVVSIQESREYRNPEITRFSEEDGFEPNPDQKAAAEAFIEDFDRGRRSVFLLHGVTGSGKTEVYIRMIEHVVSRGFQAIVLVPEIALTFQTVMRFYKRFGSRVSYLHSKLSEGERYDQFERASSGELDVMIGPRSALFTPFEKLGIIVVDEEHENSYKSEMTPRYHARETAIERAALAGAAVVLGSATPSIEAMYSARTGAFRLLTLTKRASGASQPVTSVVDMRQELREGNRSIFSRRLYRGMVERLDRKEQTMLFLNRRGYAGFVSCRECGFVYKCPHCDVTLSIHEYGRALPEDARAGPAMGEAGLAGAGGGAGKRRVLVCHYCGYEEEFKGTCPNCSSRYIAGMKAGTEQVEKLISSEFPQARVLRMDADTTRSREDYSRILSTFRNGGADILVGTQMIVKGHDFPEVTLVGILAADLSLYAPGFRSSERTFDLISQAAGRSGRASKPGEVVIQTYTPGHYAVAAAAGQDYNTFYEQECGYRRLLGYPPFSHMLKVLTSHRREEEAAAAAERLFRLVKGMEDLVVIGPAADTIGKLRDIYRKAIYIKCPDHLRLIQVKDVLEEYARAKLSGGMVMFDLE